MSVLDRRLERLESRLSPPPRPPMGPERFEEIMVQLEHLGLACRDPAKGGGWSPSDPQLLRQLLRERVGPSSVMKRLERSEP